MRGIFGYSRAIRGQDLVKALRVDLPAHLRARAGGRQHAGQERARIILDEVTAVIIDAEEVQGRGDDAQDRPRLGRVGW